ncbi:MAG: Electron transfer flavoprotein alpha subunit [Rhodospirillales bacterium]|nr:Electron transfer flavoprotein alpha subunit [Rhodospirillales bacterium]
MAGILIIAEHRQGQFRPVTLEAVAAAEKLQASSGESIAVAVIAPQPAVFVPWVSVSAVDEVVTVTTPNAEFDPDVTGTAVKALIAARKPSVVLMPHSVDSFGVAPAIAAELGVGFATDVFDLRYDGGELVATRAAYKEKVFVEIDFPGKETVLLTIRSNAFKPAGGTGQPAVTEISVPGIEPRTEHLGWQEPPASGGIDIPGAEFIMSVGRGVGDEANIEQFVELAEALGATLGCSRPIADNGWLPKARQVGQSGKLAANCKLYIAMGISGAVQHQWGMKHVENIIAVNKDADASIFTVAKYGVVGDMFEIAEELKAQAGGN